MNLINFIVKEMCLSTARKSATEPLGSRETLWMLLTKLALCNQEH